MPSLIHLAKMGCVASRGGNGDLGGPATHHDDCSSLQMESVAIEGIGNSKLENFMVATMQSSLPVKDKVVDVIGYSPASSTASRSRSNSSSPNNVDREPMPTSSPSSLSWLPFLRRKENDPYYNLGNISASSIQTDYVKLGVSVAYIDEFVKSVCGGRENMVGLTAEQVRQKFILPYIKGANLALTSLLQQRQSATALNEKNMNGETEKHAAPATWFLVYDRKDLFVNILDSVQRFFSTPCEDASNGGLGHSSCGKSRKSKSSKTDDASNGGNSLPVYIFIDVLSERPSSRGSKIYFTDSFDDINVLHVISNLQNVDTIRQCEVGLLLSKNLSYRYMLVMTDAEEESVISNLNNDNENDIIESVLKEIDTSKLEKWLITSPEASRQQTNVIKFLRNGFYMQYDIQIAASIENMFIACIQRFIEKFKAENNRKMELNFMFYLAGIYFAAERYAKAQSLYDLVLTGRRAELGDAHLDTLRVQHHLSLTYQRQGNYMDAEPLLRNCLDVSKANLGENDPRTLQIMQDLALVYMQQYMYKLAEPMLQTCLSLRREIYGEHHEDVLLSLKALADLYSRKQEYQSAEPLYLLCLNGYENVNNEKNSKTVLTVMSDLADLYNHRADYQSAEKLYMKVMSEMMESLGPTHRDTLDVMESLGSCYRYQYKYVKALPLCEDLLRYRKLMYGDAHPKVMQAINNLANCYDGLGMEHEATELHLKHSRGQLTATEAK